MIRHGERGGVAIVLAVTIAVVLAGIGAFVLWFTAESTVTCQSCAAAEDGDLSAVQAALAAITDADQRAADATSALDTALDALEIHAGTLTDHRAIVLAMLAAGADPNVYTSLAGSAGRTSPYGVSYGGGGASTIHAAERVVRLGDDDLLDRFIRAGLDVKGQPGGAALTMAAAEGRLPVVQRLIALGADVNARHDDLGSPLAAAIHGRHAAVAAVLDARGAREW